MLIAFFGLYIVATVVVLLTSLPELDAVYYAAYFREHNRCKKRFPQQARRFKHCHAIATEAKIALFLALLFIWPVMMLIALVPKWYLILFIVHTNP